ncbi:MAG: hypothetical protein EPO09_12445 [Aquabacterium sp.]|uniref:hypothetical protein n=1 Tax=Aquabacterium sp. TaxID=1872578 RepID=UPI0011F6E64F|nr:hypothetical protein [Aquabacterium sp.]TAK93507.1 MAG: hypothetical protein EPO09_12445 [Aquabacterium sp.]
MNVLEPNVNLVLDGSKSGLIAGPDARRQHQLKIDKVLHFTYLFHCVSTPVICTLLGCTNSNALRLLRGMTDKGLMHSTKLKHCEWTTNGMVFMLTARGAARAQNLHEEGEPFDYDWRPESAKKDQVEHDLAAAMFAARWVFHGGVIIETDHSMRHALTTQDRRQQKIPDFRLRFSEWTFAFELERSAKKSREIDQMLRLAFHTNPFPTVWVCQAPRTAKHMRDRLETACVKTWRLSNANKWEPKGLEHLSVNFRSRQLVLDWDDGLLDLTPVQWAQRLAHASTDAKARSLAMWQRNGFTWGVVKADPMHAGSLTFTVHHLDHEENERSFLLRSLNEHQWHVQPFQPDACDPKAAYVKASGKVVLGEHPPTQLLENAIQSIESQFVPHPGVSKGQRRAQSGSSD